MTKSGLADSPFFSTPPNRSIPISPPAEPVVEKKSTGKVNVALKRKERVAGNKKVSHHDTMTPRNRDTTVSSNHDTMVPSRPDAMVEIVRKAVKELGKEAATHRFTVEEKRGVLDLIYAYKGTGVKTSENEVARIAINYILEDYKQNGQNSILDKVLKALNE
jgi:hypothetical protein